LILHSLHHQAPVFAVNRFTPPEVEADCDVARPTPCLNPEHNLCQTKPTPQLPILQTGDRNSTPFDPSPAPDPVILQKGRTMHPFTPSHFDRYSSSDGTPRWPDDPDFLRTASPDTRPDPLMLLASTCIEAVREWLAVLPSPFRRPVQPPATPVATTPAGFEPSQH
jgi:hypothetical protein